MIKFISDNNAEYSEYSNKASMKAALLVMSVISAMLVFLSLFILSFYFFDGQEIEDLIVAAASFVTAIVLPAIALIIIKFILSIQNNKQKNNPFKETIIFEFYDTYTTCTTHNNNGGKSYVEIQYYTIAKVIEYKNYYIFKDYAKKPSSFVIFKSHINTGTLEEFNNLLFKTFNTNFIKKIKK